MLWVVAALAETVAYGRLVTYEHQRSLGTVHRLHSPLLQPLYPALGVSDVRHLILRHVVWLMIPGVVLVVTRSWMSSGRRVPTGVAGTPGA